MPEPEPRFASLGRMSLIHSLRLWREAGNSWWSLGHQTWNAYRQNHCDARSAQFAYYSLLALFPFLILLIAALARFPWPGILDNAVEAADRGLPLTVAELLKHQIADIQQHSSLGVISASLVVLAIAGSRIFLTVTEGLNAAYGVRESRRFWQVYGLAFLSTIAVSLLVLLAMTLMIIGPMLSEWLAGQEFSIVWLEVLLRRGVRWLVVCAALWIYTSTIYYLGPSLKLPWYWLSPGSVLAIVGWVFVTQGFRIYVENFGRYNETYGTLGGVIVLIIWLDLTGGMLLLGGQLNAVLHNARVEHEAAVLAAKTSTPVE